MKEQAVFAETPDGIFHYPSHIKLSQVNFEIRQKKKGRDKSSKSGDLEQSVQVGHLIFAQLFYLFLSILIAATYSPRWLCCVQLPLGAHYKDGKQILNGVSAGLGLHCWLCIATFYTLF